MSVFEKMGDFFFSDLQRKKFFLEELKKHDLGVDDGLLIINNLMEVGKCNILA